jgi:hypothetical protein
VDFGAEWFWESANEQGAQELDCPQRADSGLKWHIFAPSQNLISLKKSDMCQFVSQN